MIVVNSKAGQRSNRLFTIAHAMGTAIERGEPLRLTAFGRYAKDYPELASGHACRVVVEPSVFWEFVRLGIAAVKRVWHGFRIDIPGSLTIASDFTYHDSVNWRKHADALRRAFRPGISWQVGRSKESGEIWVGVHVRRGDYREWRGGRYCYDDQVFARIVCEMQKALEATGRDVRFFLFSNEDIQSLAKSLCVACDYSSERSDVEDQYLMSQCDYLIGPPSTFTMWASFMGKVPLLHVERPDQPIRLSDFKCSWN